MMNTEIGRELLVSDLHPPVVVVTGKDKSPARITVWVVETTPTHAVMVAEEVGVTLVLAINQDGTLQDDSGEQVHIWEYLGSVRLWVDGEDYGVMSEKAATMYLAVHRNQYPDVPAHHEPVADDAPEFLMSEEGQE